MESPLPGCSVIIIAYNSGGLLPTCLYSMGQALQGMEHQIIVLDNGSPEPLGEDFSERFPGVEFIHSHVNMGFGKACNAAAGKAIHPYLFFVNPDTLVSSDTFRATLRYMLSRPEAGLVGCRILNGDGTIQWACRRSFPSPMAAVYKTLGLTVLFPKSKRFGAYNLTYLDPDQDAEVDAISGSFFCIQRDTFIQVRGFDESFFMYGEDLDLCYRVQQAGYKNYYYPGTSIIHFKGQSSKTRALGSYVNFYQAMLVFVRKHPRFQPFPVGVVAIGIILAAVLGVFSRLLPRWWKMGLDMASVLAGWAVVQSLLPQSLPPEILPVLGVATLVPLLVLGEYSTHKLDTRHLARSLAPALGAGSLVAFLGLGGHAQVFLMAVLALLFLLAWRRAYYWGHYFVRVFSGKRLRCVLQGDSAQIAKWFNNESALVACELLGCIAEQPDSLPLADRIHLLGRTQQLENIRQRTGCKELLLVPDSWGRHDSVDPADLWGRLKIRTHLLIGEPNSSTFMMVDLNYLK